MLPLSGVIDKDVRLSLIASLAVYEHLNRSTDNSSQCPLYIRGFETGVWGPPIGALLQRHGQRV